MPFLPRFCLLPAQIPMISATSSSPLLTTLGGPYFFRVNPSDTIQGPFLASLALRNGSNVSSNCRRSLGRRSFGLAPRWYCIVPLPMALSRAGAWQLCVGTCRHTTTCHTAANAHKCNLLRCAARQVGIIFGTEPYGTGIFFEMFKAINAANGTLVGAIGTGATWTAGTLGGVLAGRPTSVRVQH